MFRAVKCIRFTSTSYIPPGCQGMSEVKEMYFHWMLQMQLSLLLASSSCDTEKLFQCNLHILVDGFVFKAVALWIFSQCTQNPPTAISL